MRLVLKLLILLFPISANATPVLADLSNYHIDIDARFIGTKIFLFGTREESGDIVVVIRGPEHEFTVRKKEKIAGIWINRKYTRFNNMPMFYMIASSKPIETMAHGKMIEWLGIGHENIGSVLETSSRKLNTDEYKTALIKHFQEKQLYRPTTPLQFMGETLFKASLEFPDSIAKGNYTAEIYLLRDNSIIGMQSLPIVVRKAGLEAIIADLAHEQPVLYGMLAILVALCSGWFANRIFHRI